MRRRHAAGLPRRGAPILASALALAAALAAAGCGSSASGSPSGSSTTSGSSPAPLKGKTITLIVPGSPGASHDLFARALAPELASELQATVDVKDMPGGGGLKGWNYTAAAKPDGLTLCIGNIEGQIANVWETVPGQNFDPTKLTLLGGEAGNRGDLMYVLLTTKTNAPFKNVGQMVTTKQKITELGAVGDVTGPLFFQMYGLNAQDLTSFSSAGAEKQALLAGNGDVLVKFYSPWVDIINSGKAHMLIAYTLRPKWNAVPSVPTLGAFLKSHPPVNPKYATGEEADVAALDAGTSVFGPHGIPANIANAEAAAVKAAFAGADYQKRAKAAHVGLVYESPQAELKVMQDSLKPSLVAEMKKLVPQSQGEAS